MAKKALIILVPQGETYRLLCESPSPLVDATLGDVSTTVIPATGTTAVPIPVDATWMQYTAISGGGGGGSGSCVNGGDNGGGGGGAAGSMVSHFCTAASLRAVGSTLTVVVGAGGAGGAGVATPNPGNNGAAGTASSIKIGTTPIAIVPGGAFGAAGTNLAGGLGGVNVNPPHIPGSSGGNGGFDNGPVTPPTDGAAGNGPTGGGGGGADSAAAGGASGLQLWLLLQSLGVATPTQPFVGLPNTGGSGGTGDSATIINGFAGGFPGGGGGGGGGANVVALSGAGGHGADGLVLILFT